MNEDTRVAVCCYAGDAHQVISNLDLYRHHECPIVILSPEDSQVTVFGVTSRFGGKRAYTGQDSVDRQRKHLEILLDFPEKYFLINDADSACISPKLPDYLYAEPDFVWSMVARDDDPREYADAGLPHVAFQPPYFLSRHTIEALLAAAGGVTMDPIWSNIDHYMVQLTVKAGLQWKGLQGALGGHFSTNPEHLKTAIRAVQRDGFIFIHGAKTSEAWAAITAAREF
jgi:hypothetical protein